MGKNEKTPVTIDGVEYKYEDMTQDQQMLVNHIADLERKISQAAFNLDQLSVGKNAFIQLLQASIEASKATNAEKEMAE